MTLAAPPVLALENLVKSYGQRRVVDDLSLQVRAGTIVGLIGPSGAGKSTTFRMATGLTPHDGGRILLDGHEISRLPSPQRFRAGLGYLPQEASILRGLTVEQNLRLIGEFLRWPRHRVTARVAELLADLALEHLKSARAAGLSGGERRRLELARCMLVRPSLLLVDEPFTGLDPLSVEALQSIFVAMRRSGVAMLMTDHGVHDMLPLLDHAYVVADGRIVADGSPGELIDREEVRRLYLGERRLEPMKVEHGSP